MPENTFEILTNNYIIEDNRVRRIVPPTRTLKITGTRFPAVLGLNPFKTPFEAWCELIRIAKRKFTETTKLKAGRVIEKSLLESLKAEYPNRSLKSPEEAWDLTGDGYDFFPNWPVFGGKWDGIGVNTIVELKTTAAKNLRYWARGVPEQHILQAALYAYLSHCDKIIIACSFIPDDAYDRPDSFRPEFGKNIGDGNSYYREFSVHDIFPDFSQNQLRKAKDFWDCHITTGLSPEFTDKDWRSGLLNALKQETAAIHRFTSI